MTKKSSKSKKAKQSGEKKQGREADIEEEEALNEMAELAKEFGTDMATVGEHFEILIDCGIIKENDSGETIFTPEFKDNVLEHFNENTETEFEVENPENKLDFNEVRLMEALGMSTLEKLISADMLSLEDENLEENFESIMKSLLFLMFVTGEFDELMEKCTASQSEKTREKEKKEKKKTKGKKK